MTAVFMWLASRFKINSTAVVSHRFYIRELEHLKTKFDAASSDLLWQCVLHAKCIVVPSPLNSWVDAFSQNLM